MAVFNQATRTENSLKTSVIGGVTNLAKILFGFGYRTAFILILSEAYLGINGLFTNVLQMLSLAELGITSAIVYRFYEPISRDDVHYVGMLMNYFGRVYRWIALTILGMGLATMPFIGLLIRDAGEIPADVNLYAIYLLFLANTCATYMFCYRLTLLTADQKNYLYSLFDLILTVLRYGVQLLLLLLTRNYTLTLAGGIAATLLLNMLGSLVVTRSYREVFAVREMLPKEDRKRILRDTRACMYHKVGMTVLNGTDNAILTRMVSLAAAGVYSNYAMLMTYLQGFIAQILGNFTASVGNAVTQMDREEYHTLFRKITFAGLWVSCMVSVCLYAVLDDFVGVWLGKRFVLGGATTVILCIYMFLLLSRITTNSFIFASGLFVKDKVRPLIESTLNLVISVILTKRFGIAGVFLGTIISVAPTAVWREPYLLYRHAFKRSAAPFRSIYIAFVAVSLAFCWGLWFVKTRWLAGCSGLGFVLAEGCGTFLLVNGLYFLLFRRREEMTYFTELLRRLTGKLLHRAR